VLSIVNDFSEFGVLIATRDRSIAAELWVLGTSPRMTPVGGFWIGKTKRDWIIRTTKIIPQTGD
jgi:hypothetical protein